MDSLILEKLKKSLNTEYADKFPVEHLAKEKFIPITKQNEHIYVGIADSINEEKRQEILLEVKEYTKLIPKSIILTNDQFTEIYAEYKRKSNNISKIQGTAVLDQQKTPVSASQTPAQIPFGEEKRPTPIDEPPVKKRLGEHLIDAGFITQEQLEEALEESKKTKTPIGSTLVKKGLITIEQLRVTLSQQKGFDFVETTQITINPKVIKLLPEDFIKENKLIPISSDGKTLMIGMVNPNDRKALNDIIYLTGLKPLPLILTHIEFENCLNEIINSSDQKSGKKRFDEGESTEQDESPPEEIDAEKIIEEIDLSTEDLGTTENIWEQVEKELEDDANINIVAKFASAIITKAIQEKASDIHIEPRIGKSIVRYRIDGILRYIFDVPEKLEVSLITRLKVISRMNIAEHRRPQDGTCSIKYGGKTYDLRVNTLPVGGREKVVIRVLQPALVASKKSKEVTLIGASNGDVQLIESMITSPHGIILVSGPTGSGKTTTLYSIINKLNSEMTNITTIEDPVEIRMNGINQTQVNPKADITFASCMRAILRQDPDIIMIGEIRDMETLEIAIKAALTGHLVLSTIHTNSASETITRLIDMGAANYLVASSLCGVLAQRLVRRLCPACKQLYDPTIDELKKVLANPDSFEAFQSKKIFKPKGCIKCDNVGYSGRLGLFEIMPINREIKKMISQSNSVIEIEEVAISCGMKTLQESCLDHILNGETSIDEFIRVLGVVSD